MNVVDIVNQSKKREIEQKALGSVTIALKDIKKEITTLNKTITEARNSLSSLEENFKNLKNSPIIILEEYTKICYNIAVLKDSIITHTKQLNELKDMSVILNTKFVQLSAKNKEKQGKVYEFPRYKK